MKSSPPPNPWEWGAFRNGEKVRHCPWPAEVMSRHPRLRMEWEWNRGDHEQNFSCSPSFLQLPGPSPAFPGTDQTSSSVLPPGGASRTSPRLALGAQIPSPSPAPSSQSAGPSPGGQLTQRAGLSPQLHFRMRYKREEVVRTQD